ARCVWSTARWPRPRPWQAPCAAPVSATWTWPSAASRCRCSSDSYTNSVQKRSRSRGVTPTMEHDDLFSVAGQVVLVSGASRGIGRALAEGFARRRAAVVITGRDAATLEQTAREITPSSGTVRPVVCDVADPKAVTKLVETVIQEFGRVDTLLNVAGVNR